MKDCTDNQLYAKTRKVEIDLSKAAGSWKLHRRQGGFVLTRGFGELLVISQCPGSADDWSVLYDEPIELL